MVSTKNVGDPGILHEDHSVLTDESNLTPKPPATLADADVGLPPVFVRVDRLAHLATNLSEHVGDRLCDTLASELNDLVSALVLDVVIRQIAAELRPGPDLHLTAPSPSN